MKSDFREGCMYSMKFFKGCRVKAWRCVNMMIWYNADLVGLASLA